MAEIVATAPPGVQTTFDKPLGPVPSKTNVGDKFRAELDKLTKPPKTEEPTDAVQTPQESPSKPAEPPTKEPETPSKPTDAVKTPASPLDAILETKPEKPAEEPDVLKEFDEKTANWQRAREVMKTQSGELKTLREKVQQLETTPKAQPNEVAELIKQRDELAQKFQQQEERLKAVNYRYSDEYQGMVAEREAVLAKISSRMKAYGGDSGALLEALQLPQGKVRTSQIKEALAELDSDDKSRVHALIETLENHEEKLADVERDLPKKWDDLVAQREVQMAEQAQEAIKQLEVQFGKVIEAIPASTVTLREVPEDVPGAKEWNDEIKSAIDRGLSALKPDGADFNQSVEIAVKGARYDTLEKRYLALHKDYVEAKKRLAEFDQSGPDFKGTPKPAEKTDKKPGVKFREALAMAQGAGVGEV